MNMASSLGIGLLRLAGVPTRYALALSFFSMNLSFGTSSLKLDSSAFNYDGFQVALSMGFYVDNGAVVEV